MSAFQDYLNRRLEEPGVRTGYEDQRSLQGVLDRLVGFRKALRLTQAEVARRMGVKQPTVSGFETEVSDPRLSTLQRYARAVEARIEIKVHWEAGCDWITPATRDSRYQPAGTLAPQLQQSATSTLLRDWTHGSLARREYAPAA